MEQGKRHRWLRPPSPAMIVAVIALIVAMSGTSYAAVTLAVNSVGTKQLKKNAVTGAKVKNGSLTGADLKAATLTANKIGPLPGARAPGGDPAGDIDHRLLDQANLRHGGLQRRWCL